MTDRRLNSAECERAPVLAAAAAPAPPLTATGMAVGGRFAFKDHSESVVEAPDSAAPCTPGGVTLLRPGVAPLKKPRGRPRIYTPQQARQRNLLHWRCRDRVHNEWRRNELAFALHCYRWRLQDVLPLELRIAALKRIAIRFIHRTNRAFTWALFDANRPAEEIAQRTGHTPLTIQFYRSLWRRERDREARERAGNMPRFASLEASLTSIQLLGEVSNGQTNST